MLLESSEVRCSSRVIRVCIFSDFFLGIIAYIFLLFENEELDEKVVVSILENSTPVFVKYGIYSCKIWNFMPRVVLIFTIFKIYENERLIYSGSCILWRG